MGEQKKISAALIEVAHPALQFCGHLRVGFYRGVDEARLWRYARHFYKTYLARHLDRQYKLMSMSAISDPSVYRPGLYAHRRLHRLFISAPEDFRTLGRIEEVLEDYVRFEKRVLLRESQLFASNPALTQREKNEVIFDLWLAERLTAWADRFWE